MQNPGREADCPHPVAPWLRVPLPQAAVPQSLLDQLALRRFDDRIHERMLRPIAAEMDTFICGHGPNGDRCRSANCVSLLGWRRHRRPDRIESVTQLAEDTPSLCTSGLTGQVVVVMILTTYSDPRAPRLSREVESA